MNNKSPNLKLNYLYRMFYEILVIIIPIITMPYISRTLGADGVGIYSYASSIVTYFVLVASLGTVAYGTREISRNREDAESYSKLFWEIELMTVLTSSCCLVAWFIFLLFNAEYKTVFFALTPTILAAMFDISWFYMGHERIIYIVTLNAISKLAGIILLFIFVRDKSDIAIYTLIQTGVLFLGNVTMWCFLPKFLVRVDYRKLMIMRHLKETIIYFIPAVATTIYTVLDKTLINKITGDIYQNGYYEQATKIINLCKTIVFSSVNSVVGVRVSYLFAQKKYEEIKDRIKRSLDFILLLGYGVSFGIIGIARNFVPLFFGNGYEPVVSLLYMMSFIVIIIGISNCLGNQYYTPSGKRKESAKYIVIGSLINLFLNVLMIPGYGAKGATIASIIAELSITVMYIKNCNSYIQLSQIVVYSWKRVISGLIMCGLVVLIGMYGVFNPLLTIAIQVCLGVVVYFGILLLFKDRMVKELLWYLLRLVYKSKIFCRQDLY